jgi:hypothetical protein
VGGRERRAPLCAAGVERRVEVDEVEVTLGQPEKRVGVVTVKEEIVVEPERSCRCLDAHGATVSAAAAAETGGSRATSWQTPMLN